MLLNNHHESILLSSTPNTSLAIAIAKLLKLDLQTILCGKFNDGEIRIQIPNNLAGKNVSFLQSIYSSTNDRLLELILTANAIHSAAPKHLTAIIPYLCYARQNSNYITKTHIEPNSAQITAKLLCSSGINKIITVDIHTEKILQYFSIPCINLYPTAQIITDLHKTKLKDLTIVAPDLGSIVRAKMLTAQLNATTNTAEFAIIYKQRKLSSTVITTKLIGKVKSCNCVIIDDIVDTATTICATAQTLHAHGAKQIIAYCTHPVLSGNAIQNITKSALTEVIVTNTIPLSSTAIKCKKIRQIDIAELIVKAIVHDQ